MISVLITGSGRGIGHEMVRQALDLGWNVIGSVRNEDDAEALTESYPKRFQPLVFDVTDAEAIKAAAAALHDPVDILINNAGVIGPQRQSTLYTDFPGFAETLDINVLGPLRVTQAFLPHLRRAMNPRIVTLSSSMGRMSNTKSDRIAYRASKAALNKVMQGLATDLKGEGIAVRLVHPGWVRTDMGGEDADLSVDESARAILHLAEQTTIVDTGTFVNYDGTEIPW